MNVGIDTDFLVRLSLREHAGHASAMATRDRHLDRGDRFALAPQVLAEFLHVVTAPRRFERPLTMETAVERAEAWWQSAEVVPIVPTEAAVAQFLALMGQHHLGRKRVLDTLLAATYLAAGVTHLMTGNADDYRVFPGLVLLEI